MQWRVPLAGTASATSFYWFQLQLSFYWLDVCCRSTGRLDDDLEFAPRRNKAVGSWGAYEKPLSRMPRGADCPSARKVIRLYYHGGLTVCPTGFSYRLLMKHVAELPPRPTPPVTYPTHRKTYPTQCPMNVSGPENAYSQDDGSHKDEFPRDMAQEIAQ